MKIAPGKIAGVLRDPSALQIILLHGEDEGLVRSRADALTMAVIGAPDDPFRVAWLAREDHHRLEEEAAAIAMLGGRRVIRVRDAGDGLSAAMERIASAAPEHIKPGSAPHQSRPALIVLEAATLTRRGKLLTLLETLPDAGVIACYPEEGAGLRSAIESGLAQSGVRADRDALDWLRDHLGGDHASTRGEIEKLTLYAAPAENGRDRYLDLDDVQACVGDQASVSLDDALFAATAGNVAGADLAVERSFAEGAAAVGLIRATLMHLTRIHAARGRMAAGATAAEAVKLMRPPVFWKREAEMVRAVTAWNAERVSAAMLETRRAELACKQTGAPDGVIARRLILALARQSARR